MRLRHRGYEQQLRHLQRHAWSESSSGTDIDGCRERTREQGQRDEGDLFSRKRFLAEAVTTSHRSTLGNLGPCYAGDDPTGRLGRRPRLCVRAVTRSRHADRAASAIDPASPAPAVNASQQNTIQSRTASGAPVAYAADSSR